MAWVCTCGQRNIVSGLPCLACDLPEPVVSEVESAAEDSHGVRHLDEVNHIGGGHFASPKPTSGHRFRDPITDELDGNGQRVDETTTSNGDEPPVSGRRFRFTAPDVESEIAAALESKKAPSAGNDSNEEFFAPQPLTRATIDFDEDWLEGPLDEEAEQPDIHETFASQPTQVSELADEADVAHDAEWDALFDEMDDSATAEEAAPEPLDPPPVDDDFDLSAYRLPKPAQSNGANFVADSSTNGHRPDVPAEREESKSSSLGDDFDALFPSPWSMPAEVIADDVENSAEDDSWFLGGRSVAASSQSEAHKEDRWSNPLSSKNRVEVPLEPEWDQSSDEYQDVEPWAAVLDPDHYEGLQFGYNQAESEQSQQPWWMNQAASAFSPAGTVAEGDDEGDYFINSDQTGQHVHGDTSRFFADDADLDEPDEYELDADEWGSTHSHGDAHSNGGSSRKNGRAITGASFNLGSIMQQRSKLAIILLIVVVAGLLSTLGRDVFKRVAAAPSDTGIVAAVSCSAAKNSGSVSKAASLQSAIATAPTGLSAVPDYQADSGAIDFTRALALEPSTSTALNILDQTRFQRGYWRTFAGPNGVKASTSIYEFPAAPCAADYLASRSSSASPNSFAVTGVPGAIGSVETVGKVDAYVVRAQRDNRVLIVSCSGKETPSELTVEAVSLAQSQWDKLA